MNCPTLLAAIALSLVPVASDAADLAGRAGHEYNAACQRFGTCHRALPLCQTGEVQEPWRAVSPIRSVRNAQDRQAEDGFGSPSP